MTASIPMFIRLLNAAQDLLTNTPYPHLAAPSTGPTSRLRLCTSTAQLSPSPIFGSLNSIGLFCVWPKISASSTIFLPASLRPLFSPPFTSVSCFSNKRTNRTSTDLSCAPTTTLLSVILTGKFRSFAKLMRSATSLRRLPTPAVFPAGAVMDQIIPIIDMPFHR